MAVEYEYECKTCGAFLILRCGMDDPKPKVILGGHAVEEKIFAKLADGDVVMTSKRDERGPRCPDDKFVRAFTMPGMAIHFEDRWNIRGPGGLANDRRDKRWRDRFAKRER